jgi:hypothetical protein
MAQVISCWPLTGETGVSACGFVVDKVALGQVFLHVLQFPMSISFHHGSPYSLRGSNSSCPVIQSVVRYCTD